MSENNARRHTSTHKALRRATLLLTTLFCLSMAPTTASAQHRSHIVSQGQNVTAIARSYGVSVKDILKLNPAIGNGDKIRPGQKLILPDNAAQTPTTTTAQGTPTQTQPNVPARTTGQPEGVRVIAIPDAQEQNTPQGNGYHIDLPRNTQQGQAAQQGQGTLKGYLGTGCKEMYKIKKKDTLYKLALDFGLTIEELVAANPGLTKDSKLKKGEFLCIPYSRAERQAEADRIAAEKAEADRIAAEKAEAERQQQQAAAKAAKSKHLRMAVLLPLKDTGSNGAKMVEFYQGLLMAVDSLKQQGTSVDVYTMHSGNTAAELQELLYADELKKVDVIFGPLYADQANLLSEFCQKNKIRLVMPFGTTSTYGMNNPYVYHASTSANDARANAVSKTMKQFPNSNFILLKTAVADDRGARFTDDLRQALSANGQGMKVLNIEGDEAAFASAFNQFQDNIVVPDASSLTATTSIVKKIRAFKEAHPEYTIRLLGYPEWPTYAKKLQADFYAIDTYAYTSFYRDPTEPRVLAFDRRFVENFNKSMAQTTPRYGLMGFDLGYYFLHGLATQGDTFDQNQTQIYTRPYQNPFFFTQQNENVSHNNEMLMFIHYTPAMITEIIK